MGGVCCKPNRENRALIPPTGKEASHFVKHDKERAVITAVVVKDVAEDGTPLYAEIRYVSSGAVSSPHKLANSHGKFHASTDYFDVLFCYVRREIPSTGGNGEAFFDNKQVTKKELETVSYCW